MEMSSQHEAPEERGKKAGWAPEPMWTGGRAKTFFFFRVFYFLHRILCSNRMSLISLKLLPTS